MHLDAMISVGCIVFSMVADTLLKPLRWAAGKAVDVAKKIADKLPDFAKRTISYVKNLPSKIKNIPLVNKCYDTVKNICSKLSKFIDDIFKRVDKWSLPPFERGLEIENSLAKTKYFFYDHVGKKMNGFFPVFDFIKGKKGISVKTLDLNAKSYKDIVAVERKISQYASDMNEETIKRKFSKYIKENTDKSVKKALSVTEKELHIYVPKGTKQRISNIVKEIGGIKIKIFEY